jgi:hypothetical protein
LKNILAIDPGASGGLALYNTFGLTDSWPMPDTMPGQIDLLRSLYAVNPGMACIIEKVGSYRPGNSGPGACTFARHCGHLEAACYALGIPVEQVAPSVWQKALGALPKEKPERKRMIRDLMARRYPHLSVTLKTADALGLLTWAISR